MSFSRKVKEELANNISNAQHCRIAEIAAIISMCGSVIIDENEKYSVRIKTETEATAIKYRELLWKTFRIKTEIVKRSNAYSKNVQTYIITIKDNEEALKVLQATKLVNEWGWVEEDLSISNNIVIRKECCKRAFIRGAFLRVNTKFPVYKAKIYGKIAIW